MFTKVVSIISNTFIYYKSLFIKKDKNIWLFGAIRGQKYCDNAKYLFEYVHNNTDIKAIWISKNKELVSELKIQGFSAFHENSLEAIYYGQRAKIAIITHRGNREDSDLPFHLFSKKTEIIQLWHGIPLKKIAYDDKVFSFKDDEDSLRWKVKKLLKRVFFPFLNYVNEPSLILALSNDTKEIFSKAFRVSDEKVLVTGYPRNDILLKAVSNEGTKQKQIIYMPTFRGSINSDFDLFLQYGFDIERLDIFLSQNKIRLDIKLHLFNQPSPQLISKLEKSKNIYLLNHDAIYEIINRYDMLITDYSSIYFDYLLLNRPIIFTPFDKEEYLENDREFYFDYNKVTPGPKAKNWNDVIEWIEAFEKTPSMYEEERILIKNKFHRYQDMNSCKRVYQSILDIIE